METTTKPLALPEIKTTETAYDKFKKARAALVAAFRNPANHQIFGATEDDAGGFCFVGLAKKISERV